MAMTILQRFSVSDISGIKDSYEQHGVVIINDLLAPRDLAQVKLDIEQLICYYLDKAGLPRTDLSRVFSDGLQQLEASGSGYVGAIYDTIYQMPSFMRLISNEKLDRTIKLLLGLDFTTPLYGYTNRCLFAPPNDERRTYGWHQEVFYTIPDSRYIQTWGPLVFDTTSKGGTIELCLGSHKEGIAKQQWLEIPGRNIQVLVDDTVVNKYEQVPVEMNVGEIALFSGYMIHRSGTNTSDHVRYSLVGMFHDVSHPGFVPPKINYHYRQLTPKEYFDQVNPA